MAFIGKSAPFMAELPRFVKCYNLPWLMVIHGASWWLRMVSDDHWWWAELLGRGPFIFWMGNPPSGESGWNLWFVWSLNKFDIRPPKGTEWGSNMTSSEQSQYELKFFWDFRLGWQLCLAHLQVTSSHFLAWFLHINPGRQIEKVRWDNIEDMIGS